ncbi:MAG: L-tyrosine/L-tryptophan isonitrile synthase family protein [Alphaproteobacteria bacterium]|nr:L-tyrosine/L-tryptophan isonitrile synthase family protein [Alphaproteobacteria bacterium]
MYKSKFPKSIHLSAHYQQDIGKKVGIVLSPRSITSWHGVALLNKDGSFSIKRKKDLSKNLKLSSKTINGIICRYHIEN